MLKDTVEAAATGETIFIRGTVQATKDGSGVTANSGEIVIDKDLTIQGKTGATSDILDANSSGANHPTTPHRIFTVSSGKTLTLQNLTLKNAKDQKGGGILVYKSGTAVLSDCSIENCEGDGGGAIGCNANSTVKLTNTSIKNCKAYNSGFGGAIYANGATVQITNCSLTGNEAGNGGAVYAKYDGAPSNAPSVITIKGGTIGGTGTGEANKATGTAPKGNGGAIYIGGRCTLTLGNNDQNKGCTVQGNTANNNGGGVYVDSNSIFNMHGGTIKNNISSQGKGVYVAGSSGAMYDQDGSFIMGGKACVGEWENDTLKDDNDVYLAENNASGLPASIEIDKDNPITESKVACITPQPYIPNEIVVQMSDGSSVGDYTNKFTVTPNGSEEWYITPTGVLKKR